MSTTTLTREVPLLTPPMKRDTLDFWLQQLKPTFSLHRTLAEVVGVERETPGIMTVSLRPNRRWRGFTAGQHVLVTVEVDGRRLTRPWTIASGDQEDVVRLSIGRQPGGRVTTWVHERLQCGDVVELSEARGEFTLPDDPRLPLLFIAGGTGITPFLSMLRTLRARRESRDIALLYYVRDREHALALEELEAMQSEATRDTPSFTLHVIAAASASRVSGYFERSHLDTLVPDWTERRPYLCGPPPMMELVENAFRAVTSAPELTREYFRPPAISTAGEQLDVTLSFRRSQREVRVPNRRNLLDEAESAGLSPHHGCRSGICRECTCTKVRGVVENLRTGAISREDGEAIQICISRPLSDVVLDI